MGAVRIVCVCIKSVLGFWVEKWYGLTKIKECRDMGEGGPGNFVIYDSPNIHGDYLP